jgi:hypothetical protein
MSKINQRNNRKERFWRRMMRQWGRSGLSIRAFCAEQQISEPNFYAWRRTIAQRDAEMPCFVPVQVVSEADSVATPEGSSLELVLSPRRVLRIGPGFDGPTLRRLLALLEEGQP